MALYVHNFIGTSSWSDQFQ